MTICVADYTSDEIETEIASGPLSEERQEEQNASTAAQQKKKHKPHPGRNELPAHLERIEEIVACAAKQCTCGKCGRETQVIGYEETEVLGMKPAVHFVRVIKREKRACARCIEQGVATAPGQYASRLNRSSPTKPLSTSSSANIAMRCRSIASARFSCAISASMWH
jgi:hypothetical protein